MRYFCIVNVGVLEPVCPLEEEVAELFGIVSRRVFFFLRHTCEVEAEVGGRAEEADEVRSVLDDVLGSVLLGDEDP